MPRAVADSDDDEDDLFAETNHPEPAALIPEDTATFNAEAGTNNVDKEQSTGSTEHLRRQIQIAERGLLTNSATETMRRELVISSDSPSVRAVKRRNTAADDAEGLSDSQRSAKRSKTTHTYGSKRQSNVLAEDSTFQSLLYDDIAPGTSQSAHFTEHSGLASSTALPSGNIPDDFLNHEPNLMFQDSGSTVADTSSAQQRLLAQTRAKVSVSDASKPTNMISNQDQDSSIPFSTIDDNNYAGPGSQQKPLVENGVLPNADMVQTNSASDIVSAGHDTVDPRQLLLAPNEASLKETRTQASQVDSGSNIVLSPTVEIPRNETAEMKADQPAANTTKKVRLGRIRKANANNKAEAPVSDDRPIGLPAEQYKPRPSKRRAAPIAEETIDYSVRPEKAATGKKRRTASAGAASELDQADEDVSPDGVGSAGSAANNAIRVHEAVTEDPPATVQQTGNVPVEASQNTTLKDGTSADTTHASAEASESSEIVVVSAPLTQKSKKGSESKKSRTAVLEDPAKLNVSEESPDPGQELQNKDSPLQEVENEARPTQRRRRNVIVDEEDGEDNEDDSTPVKEAKTVQEETAAKKRGRGRPAKSAAKTQPESTEKVLGGSGENDENQPQQDEGPKKGGRGRPAKTSGSSKSTTKVKDNLEQPPAAPEPPTEAPRIHEKTQSAPQSAKSKSEVITSNRSSGELPTPSPEKPKIAKKDDKPRASLHPEKGPLKAQYRVGLSQRARIPPLHRNIKPQKR